MKEAVSTAGDERGRGVAIRWGGCDEQIDRVLVSLINERDNRFAIEIIESASGQWETFAGEIAHRRREIDFAVEPRFHGVLVGRGNIDKMRGEKRAHVIANDLISNRVAGR